MILAELGTDMSRFPTAAHAASWVGLAPGKNESAGRNRSARIAPGKGFLKVTLVQAAHAAGSSRDNYLSARTILVIAYHMLRNGTEYVDLRADYFDWRNEQQVQRHLVKRLEHLGFKVSLEPLSSA